MATCGKLIVEIEIDGEGMLRVLLSDGVTSATADRICHHVLRPWTVGAPPAPGMIFACVDEDMAVLAASSPADDGASVRVRFRCVTVPGVVLAYCQGNPFRLGSKIMRWVLEEAAIGLGQPGDGADVEDAVNALSRQVPSVAEAPKDVVGVLQAALSSPPPDGRLRGFATMWPRDDRSVPEALSLCYLRPVAPEARERHRPVDASPGLDAHDLFWEIRVLGLMEEVEELLHAGTCVDRETLALLDATSARLQRGLDVLEERGHAVLTVAQGCDCLERCRQRRAVARPRRRSLGLLGRLLLLLLILGLTVTVGLQVASSPPEPPTPTSSAEPRAR